MKKPSEAQPYYSLDPAHTDPARVKRERAKGRELKKSNWWHQQVQRGICHHCGKKFAPAELTLDHLVPIARGGESKPGNCVPSCHACNQSKKLDTPVDDIFRQLEAERAARETDSESDPDPES